MSQLSTLAATLLTLLSCPGSRAQDPGLWTGGLRLGGEYLPFEMQIGSEGTGSIEVPGRGIFAWPVEGSAGTWEFHLPGARRGRLQGRQQDDVFQGVFSLTVGGRELEGRFQAVAAYPMEADELRSYEGGYDVEGLGPVRVLLLETATRRSLQVCAVRLGNQLPAFPVSPDEFVLGMTAESSPAVIARLRFLRENGGIAGLEVERPGAAATRGPRRDPRPVLDLDALRARIEADRERHDVPGYSVGIVHEQDLLWVEGFGHADLEQKRPAAPDTRYQIGSISKTFAATLAMQLRDEGKLRLDDRVPDHLPEPWGQFPVFRGDGSSITVRHLLTHSSGLPRVGIHRVDTAEGVPAPFGVEQLRQSLEDGATTFAPGTHWSYSNLGYGLLGHLLERVSGESLEDLLRTRIFEPLGMRHSSIALDRIEAAELATHHWIGDRPRRPRPRWVFGAIAANGGIVSTVPDLARYLSLQLRAGRGPNGVLAATSLAEMHQPQRRRDLWSQAMGMGWWVDHDAALGEYVHHGGEIDGHSSFLAFSPNARVGVIVLANLGGPTADRLGRWLFAEVVESTRARALPSITEADQAYHDGRWHDAAALQGALASAAPHNGTPQYRHGVALLALQRLAEADAAFERAIQSGYARSLAHFHRARIAAAQARNGDSISHLRDALAAGLDRTRIRREPAFASLKGDPEFRSLLERN